MYAVEIVYNVLSKQLQSFRSNYSDPAQGLLHDRRGSEADGQVGKAPHPRGDLADPAGGDRDRVPPVSGGIRRPRRIADRCEWERRDVADRGLFRVHHLLPNHDGARGRTVPPARVPPGPDRHALEELPPVAPP